MLNDDYPNNPFKLRAMANLNEDLHAYILALTEIQVTPKFETTTANFRHIIRTYRGNFESMEQ